MTVGEFRRVCASQIAAFAPDEASVLCDILLAHVLGCDRSALLLSLDRKLEEADARRMAEAVSELSLGVPVQYIVGSCWFYNREIKVGRGCFIPRGDTEFLAAAAVAALPEGGSFADLCSGSGCVAAAIASTLKPKKGYALELSRKALAYTEENLKDFDNVAVRRFDVLDEEDYLALAAELDGGVDVLVSNPPYIPTDDIAALDVQVHYEPENALDGGEDGLRYYREIVRNAPLILNRGGTILFEVGIRQSDDVRKILADAGYSTACIKDDQKIERVVLGKKIDNGKKAYYYIYNSRFFVCRRPAGGKECGGRRGWGWSGSRQGQMKPSKPSCGCGSAQNARAGGCFSARASIWRRNSCATAVRWNASLRPTRRWNRTARCWPASATG